MKNRNSGPEEEEAQFSPRRTVYRLLLMVAGSIMLTETALMFVFDRMLRMRTLTEDLIDGFILTLLVSPVLYLYLFRPMSKYIMELHEARGQLRNQRDLLEEKVQQRTAELVERNEQQAALVQELKDAEEKYRNLVECLPSVTYVMTLNGNEAMTFISPQIERLGYVMADWLETPEFRSQRMHPEDRARVEQAFAHSRETGEPFRCDYRLYGSDNEVHWFHDEASVVCDWEGKVSYLQGVMLDVTENKAMEEELAEHRYRMERSVERRTELMERRINVLESANSRLCGMLNEYEDRLRRAKTVEMPELLKSLTDDAVIVTDREGRVTMLNLTAENMLAATCEKVLNRPLAEVLPLAGGHNIEDLQRRCLEEKERVQLKSATLLLGEGGSKEVFGWVAPILDANDETISMLVLLHPAITDEACY